MCSEFIIEILVKPTANQPIPTEEELDELEQILTETTDSFLDRLAEDSDEDGGDDENEQEYD